jgi:hypothetical protein
MPAAAPTPRSPLERPVYRPARQPPRVANDEEEDPGFLGSWKGRAVLGLAGAAAVVLVCFGWRLLSSDHVRVYPAHGQALLSGKPIPNASIQLDPVWTKDPGFPRPRATVQDDGSFVVGTYGRDDGAPAGEYRVAVQWLVKADKAEVEGGALPRNVLPPKYGKFDTSGLTVMIEERENTLPALQLKR